MSSERTIYRERTPWPGFASVILWGIVIPTCYGIVSGAASDLPILARLGVAACVVAAAVGLTKVFGGLTVHVGETRLFVHLGSVPLVRKSIAFHDIRALQSVTYRPLAEFGGWGLRKGRGGRTAWTARGDRAVKLEMEDGREIFLGSDHPQRLEERIRTSAGGTLARWADVDEPPR